MTSRPHLRVAVAAMLALSAVLAIGLSATSPVFWRVSTQEELLRGTADNVSIDAGGRLLLGPNAERVVETGVPFLWSLVRAADALWVGGGPPGVVYRVTPGGAVTTVLDGAEGDAQALAAGTGGRVFAATAPDGRIVALDAGGTRREVLDTERNPTSGRWRRRPTARCTPAPATPGPHLPGHAGRRPRRCGTTRGTAHVRSLAVDAAGRVYAGTGSPRTGTAHPTPGGRAFVLLDTNHDEITSSPRGPGRCAPGPWPPGAHRPTVTAAPAAPGCRHDNRGR